MITWEEEGEEKEEDDDEEDGKALKEEIKMEKFNLGLKINLKTKITI